MEELATLGGGCFWCTEAVYLRIPGVISVESGYAGGTTKNPTYKEICTGTTGHAEVIRIRFDNTQISFSKSWKFFGRHTILPHSTARGTMWEPNIDL